jgi:hypothetical protein
MYLRRRLTVLVIVFAILPGCSIRRGSSDIGICPINLRPYVRTTLYIGNSRYFAGDGWKQFTEDVLVKHLPAGGSVIENDSGWWRRPDGSTAMGGGRLLIILAPMNEITTHRAGIQAVIAEIKRVTGHLSVGWEEDRLCATF